MGVTAAFFTDPAVLLHAWFFALATAISLSFGARFYVAADISHTGENARSPASPLTQKPDQARRRFRLGMLVLSAYWLGVINGNASPKLGLAMLFGVGFGPLIERAQICFTSAFRDL